MPAIWWDNPLSTLMLIVGWCCGLLARKGGHAVRFSASRWLVCDRRGHMYVGRDALAAATTIHQRLPKVLEIWYFSLPSPAMA